MTVTVRDATPGDLDAMVEVFLACWRESYSEVLPPELTGSMPEDRARILWSTALATPASRILVAEDENAPGTVLGMTRHALEPTVENGVRVAVVESLYVSPTAQGRGLGKLLLGAAVDSIAATSAQEARLWVFAANRPSIDFYRSQGWRDDGTTRVEAAYGEVELRMSRPVPSRPSTPEGRRP
ncbi:N-acetyltransferase family protein [Herbiconiux sp. YIM B11900]|uniref:GNAT family N-acetyltransferase n=1 Tax=Herbiconiux sp. YIM B11900 TaxID=3404131 RepID=UPI003F832F42